MTTFPGFAFSGYRTLTGEAQWISLGAPVTVFLGGNNSGKSNVLRLIHTHMRELFQAARDSSSPAGFDMQLDQPLGVTSTAVELHWPLDADSMTAATTFDTVRPDLDRMFSSRPFSRFGVPTLPFSASVLNQSFDVHLGAAREILSLTPEVSWANLSHALTQTRGGNEGEDTQRVLMKLREWMIQPPETVVVPATRSVTGDGHVDQEWNFSGAGMILQLARLKSPRHHERHLQERARALTHDLRILLEDDDLDWTVPHDHSTVNVTLHGNLLPLYSLGTGTEHAVIILAARHVHPDRLLCLEEPDAHLHPRLQRRLITLLREDEGRRVALATHSAHMIDAADEVVAVRLLDRRSSIDVVGDHTLFEALRSLGYRASDLLQTNCIVWVEGPSDRIFLLHWLKAVDPDLVEGVDFSIAFYGGALLTRLSAKIDESTSDDPTLVDLWRINRRMWLVMDSDQGGGELKPAVRRLQEEVKDAGVGGTWITAGYTIENYLEFDVFNAAVRKVHQKVETVEATDQKTNPFTSILKSDGNPLKNPDKVGIALAACSTPARLDVLDLRQRVMEIVGFIRDNPPESVLPVALEEKPPTR